MNSNPRPPNSVPGEHEGVTSLPPHLSNPRMITGVKLYKTVCRSLKSDTQSYRATQRFHSRYVLKRTEIQSTQALVRNAHSSTPI